MTTGTLSFFDMAVSVTPPTGHAEPMPITLGPNWQPNDLRFFFIAASGTGDQGASAEMMPMHTDPPPTMTSAYTLNPGGETEGVYWRRLVSGDQDSVVSWPKPQGWRHFVWSTLTIRGADPTTSPTAGRLWPSCNAGDDYATIAPVSVPGAGVMLFCLGTVADPGGGGIWPSWSTAMGVPSGWSHLVATEKSGANFYKFDTSQNVMVVGKVFTAAGTTGTVQVPIGKGAPAFAGLWAYVKAASSVSITIGSA